MTAKLESKTLDDGQVIFIIGTITRSEFNSSIIPAEDMELGYCIDDHVINSVLGRRFKTECDSTLQQWLTDNNAQLIFHVDKSMFKNYSGKTFEWGFGFAPECSVESLFVLKWI